MGDSAVKYDPLHYPCPSRRMVQYGRKGMVAASQPLAAGAGMDMLKRGGNAVDAAVATAACLTVVEPTSNGIGGDAFVLVWTGGRLYGLNASGPAPASIGIEAVRKLGHAAMPALGWLPVTVPGAPASWAELSRRFGRLPFSTLLAPAIEYAARGHPVSPVVAHAWRKSYEHYRQVSSEEFRPWLETFAPGGRTPAAGEVWASRDHALSLQAIADSGAEDFYRGRLAERIDASSREHGAFLRAEDLAAFRPEWTEAIGVDYRGFDVWEMPPNGQGLVALMALNVLKRFDLAAGPPELACHLQLEAMKAAFADGLVHITEPGKMRVTVEELLSESFAREQAARIAGRAHEPAAGTPVPGGTVYLATADGEGTMVSFIQSNYMGFGSGIVVPGTGISLQNRGHTFSLDRGHANCLEPGKRTYHTIIPGFLTRAGSPVGPFGVMGGFMQPQGHLQVLTGSIDLGLNPQAVLDSPRWRWEGGRTVLLEHGFSRAIARALEDRGHDIRWAGPTGFGRGQIIWRDAEGVLVGATEPRCDGAVLAW
ncbi:MAG TPA: gamma-glutamyltransferase family protein [Bacillota bacterium]|nr:gamma-glutamyltransferase family protein [Bacillota bacterium]